MAYAWDLTGVAAPWYGSVMNTTAVPHPKATANRVALSHQIVGVLDASPGLFAAGHPTSLAVSQFGPAVWADVNAVLGRTRPISPMTVAVVVGLLAAREI